mgnify:CR=1 FL=1
MRASHLALERRVGILLHAASPRQRAAVNRAVWRHAALDRRELGVSFGLLYRARATAVLTALRDRPDIVRAIRDSALDIDRFVRTAA